MVVTTKEGYLIPTYGATGISPAAGAEDGMTAIRAAETQREQTLTARQARNVTDQQQRRIEEDRARAAADRAQAEAERKKYIAGMSTPDMGGAAPGTPLAPVQYVPVKPKAGLTFGPNAPTSSGVIPPAGEPLSFGLVRSFESFSDNPYWDVDAYRAGYGSDTVTRADGTVVPIKPGMTVTREDAERDLARRVNTEFTPRAEKQVGPEVWASLPEHVRGALVSVTYNYGSLPRRIIPAIKSGDIEAIANAVEALGSDNEGVNARRRAQEAAIIRSGWDIDPGLRAAALRPVGEPAPAAGFIEPGAAIPPERPGDFAAQATQQGLSPTDGGSSPLQQNEFVLTQTDTPITIPNFGMVNYVQYNPATGEIRGPNGQPLEQTVQDQVREGASFNYADALENTAGITANRLEAARQAVDEAAASGDQARYSRALADFRQAQAAADAAQTALPDAEAALRTTQPVTSRGSFAEEGPGSTQVPRAAGLTEPPKAETAVPVQVRIPGGGTLNLGTVTPAGAKPEAYPLGVQSAGIAGTGDTVVSEVMSAPRGQSVPPPSRAIVDAGPARMTQEMALLEQKDAQLALLQQYHAGVGDIPSAAAIGAQRLQLRASHQSLQGSQALARLDLGDYSMIGGVLSNMLGAPIQLQPRSDGTFNLLANGQPYAEGLTAAELKSYAQGMVSDTYRQQQSELQKKLLDAEIELYKEREKGRITALTEVAKLIQMGHNKEAEIRLQAQELTATVVDGKLYLSSKDGQAYIIDENYQVTDSKGRPIGQPTPRSIYVPLEQ